MMKNIWRQGEPSIKATENFTEAEKEKAEYNESLLVYKSYHSLDDERSRQLVGTFLNPEDAMLAAEAPMLLQACKSVLNDPAFAQLQKRTRQLIEIAIA